MVTLKEVAAQCGYTIATVSKALNGKPDINPQTRKRIVSIAKNMGYVPNTAARTLKTNSSHIIGLMFFLVDTNIWEHSYFSQIAANIQSITEKHGYDIAPVNLSIHTPLGSYVDYCRHRNYDGVIMMCVDDTSNTLMEFVNSDIPMVTIDSSFPTHDSVISDNDQGIRELVRYVVSKGHKKIAFIHGTDSLVTQSRISGFFDECSKHNIHIPCEYVHEAIYCHPQSTAKILRKLLALPNPPTCVFCPDDYSALGALNELHIQNLHVPKDISLVGYDGLPLPQQLQPALTTLHQDVSSIGKKAAEMLIDAIENPDKDTFNHLLLPGKLIKGQSVLDLSKLS